MKKRVLAIIILIFIASCSNGNKESKMNGIDKNQDVRKVERFNFEATKGGTKDALFKQEEWMIEIGVTSKYQIKYAPAKEFYEIYTSYNQNGNIRLRGKYLANLPFGVWEYFDESGRPVKTVDEDAKFGKVKPADIVAFMERQGIFNRETGESIFFDKPLPTDGTFYREIAVKLDIGLVQEKDIIPEYKANIATRKKLRMERYDKENKFIPVWYVSYRIGIEITTYYIDGNDINNFFMSKDTYNYTL